MSKEIIFSFIGGDLRQVHTVKELANEGYRVYSYGIEKENQAHLRECILKSDVIVLPLPYTKDGYINAPLCNEKIRIKDIVNYAGGKIILAGKADDEIKELCRENNIKLIDYSAREDFAILNSVPSSEGAIQVAMENSRHTIHNSRCLVVGYGKIGKVLSGNLKSLGARVYASARKNTDFSWIKSNGYIPLKTGEIYKSVDKMDIIFNTVPNLVIDKNVLERVKDEALIIDLASKPGGVDFKAADQMNKKVIWALSLPGKVAPVTSGEIIKETILNILSELGV